jgi:chemotaxis protein MotB
MSGKNEEKRPIIIKRKKVVGGGHHGGAWKVAYADFVTAMMAFFMLMWLLNSTTDNQRHGLADYFSPTLAIQSAASGGEGALSGQSLAADSINVQMGRGGITQSEVHGTTEEEATMEAVEAAILGKGGDSLLDEEALRHVSVRLTDEGLVVEFFALAGSPLFNGVEPTTVLTRLLASVAPEVNRLPNALAISAHTSTEPVVTLRPQAWPLSSERANAVRRALSGADISPDRVVRITGHADRRPATADPLSSRNDRVELVILRDQVAARR